MLTIELPGPGRAVLISKVEVRLCEKGGKDGVGRSIVGTDLGDTLGRKRAIPVGRPFLALSRCSRIGGYAWRIAEFLYERLAICHLRIDIPPSMITYRTHAGSKSSIKRKKG
jgi:hypothetical protein